ncbi:hypothetical protein PMAYCL1PPCAC_27134, partial [Pristionchus mayeri]
MKCSHSFRNSEDLLVTPSKCLVRMVPQFFGICGSITSMLAMSLERLQASRKLSTYEMSSEIHGNNLIVLHLLLTFAGVYVDYVKYDFPTRVAQCSAASVGGMQLQSALSAFFFLSALFTIFLCKKLLKKNEHIHTSEESLSMTLSESFHTSITMAGAFGFLYFKIVGFPKEVYPMFENVINLVYLQGIAMPLIFLSRHRRKIQVEKQVFETNLRSGEDLIKMHGQLLVFRLFSSAFAIACMIVLERNKGKFVARKSVKVLMNFHGLWTFLLCISTFYESALQLYAHFTIQTPSELLMTSSRCLIRMTPQFFGMTGSVTSMLVMSFERFEASTNLSDFESSPSKYGWKFIILHIILTLLGVYVDMWKYGFPARVPHCSIASVLGHIPQHALASAYFLSALFTIFFCCKLLKRNTHVLKAEESLLMTLSERYQLSENIRVLRVLLPIVISHTSIIMGGAVGFFFFDLAGFQKELYPIFEDTINLVYLQGMAMPMIFLSRYRNKRLMESRIVNTNMSTGTELIAVHD